jgi:hypothetical protein
VVAPALAEATGDQEDDQESWSRDTPGGETVRPGAAGGGTIEEEAPGSSHDTGIRGPGTVGEGRARI